MRLANSEYCVNKYAGKYPGKSEEGSLRWGEGSGAGSFCVGRGKIHSGGEAKSPLQWGKACGILINVETS